MNYKKLLIKYIYHIGYHEGIDYLDDNLLSHKMFTEEETAELKKLSEESTSVQDEHPAFLFW